MRVRIVLLVAALASGPLSATERAIYRCTDASGAPTFTDLPCESGQRVAITPPTIVDAPDLTPAERMQLEQIDRAMPRRAAAAAPALRYGPDRAAERCADARLRLDEVRAKKRRGYKASQAATLDARERNARARVERACD